MTDAERKAMEWLGRAVDPGCSCEEDNEHRAAIRSALGRPKVAPKTFEIERWVVVGPNGVERSTHRVHSYAIIEACQSGGSVVRLTGKATVEA